MEIVVEFPGITTEEIQAKFPNDHPRRVSEALTRLRRRCVAEWRHGRGKGWYATGLPVEQEAIVDATTPWSEDIAARIAVDECPNGMHMQTIAELMGVSRQRVEQIIRKATGKVRHEILRARAAEEHAHQQALKRAKHERDRKFTLEDSSRIRWFDEDD